MPVSDSGRENVSQSVINVMRQQKSADVYVTKKVTIPAKSYFFLPIALEEKEEKQQSAFFYVRLLQTLRDRHDLPCGFNY